MEGDGGHIGVNPHVPRHDHLCSAQQIGPKDRPWGIFEREKEMGSYAVCILFSPFRSPLGHVQFHQTEGVRRGFRGDLISYELGSSSIPLI